MTREAIQDMFIRTCRDSGFSMDWVRAAQFTADVLKINPLQVWLAMPSADVLEEIAAGTHPAVTNRVTKLCHGDNGDD
jgi:hypothetical protein